MGPKFIKINSAPLEEEVYVVANTSQLDGKEVSIKIKEKQAVIVAANADLTVLEAKENGNDITILKAVVDKGIAKIKIKLRPKADDTLKTWKEKLTGIKDGTYTYTFGSDNTTTTAEQKKRVAGIIVNRTRASLTALQKFAKADAIEKVLTKESYNKDEQITFDVYKTVTEYLWLEAECQGDTQKHTGEFLKRDGQYFEIGKGKCPRCGVLTMAELDLIFTSATAEKKTQLMNAFNLANTKFGLNTCQQKAHFFAQVREEVGTGINISEGEVY